jgi:uncharacterized membrane protein
MRNLKLWVILPPFLALLVTAVYLHFHWNRLPERFPVHWGIDSAPNEWASRNWRGVYGPLLFGAFLDGFLIGLSWIISLFARKTPMRYVTVRGLQFLLYPLTLSIILLSLLPLVSIPVWVIPSLVLASIAALLYWSYATISVPLGADEIPAELQNGSHWKAGIFYWNPNDPALLVPKRVGIGYTMNFASKWAWMALIAILLVILISVFFMPHGN